MRSTAFVTVLQDLEGRARENHWPIIGLQKGSVLVDTIEEHHPTRILELGALVGYSSTLMAAHLEEDGKVTSIEIDEQNAEMARDAHKRAGVDHLCEVIVGRALDVIPTLDGPFDMLFIDARKEDYLNYLKAAEPKLTPDAIVIADNVKMAAEDVADYLEYVRNSGRYRSSYRDFGNDGVEVSFRVE